MAGNDWEDLRIRGAGGGAGVEVSLRESRCAGRRQYRVPVEKFYGGFAGRVPNGAGEAATIGRLELPPGEGRFVWNPPTRHPQERQVVRERDVFGSGGRISGADRG